MAKSLIEQLNDDTTPIDVLTEGVSVVLFGAPWCGPCKQMLPTLETLARKYKDRITVYEYDMDAFHWRSVQLGIAGIPTLVIFENGHPRRSAMGFQSLDKIEEQLHTVLLAEKAV